MKTETIKVDQHEAAKLYRTYMEHRGVFTKEDQEIARIYRQIARSNKVIRAYESIRNAGFDTEGRPLLAIARADVRQCRFDQYDGYALYRDANRQYLKSSTLRVTWKGLPFMSRGLQALVPLIPVYLRPRKNLADYHILWEADWTAVPVDPMLLRKIGGDAWLVVAAWDLTEAERAVLAGRV